MSFDRAEVARHLYHDRRATEPDRRQSMNSRFGAVDLVSEIVKRVGPASGDRVLDVGCGNGEFVLAFAQCVGPTGIAMGVDFSKSAVELCMAKGVLACVADAVALPFAQSTFNTLICNYAAYYFADITAAILQWWNVVASGGVVMVSGPACGNNDELYRFHRDVIGRDQSDADRMATGYVGTIVARAATEQGFAITANDVVENPVCFPSTDDFIRYWSSTSLFARTVPENDRQEALTAGRRALPERAASFTVTKRVTVLALRRP